MTRYEILEAKLRDLEHDAYYAGVRGQDNLVECIEEQIDRVKEEMEELK